MTMLRYTPACAAGALFFSLLAAGCAASHAGAGRDYLDEEQYEFAVREFVSAVREDSTDAANWRDLGIALAGRGDTSLAIASLRRALSIEPDDGETLLRLGSLHEDREEYGLAISYYRLYGRTSVLSDVRSELEARLEYLTRKQLQADARQAIAAERSVDVEAIPENTVAVLPFRNIGENRDLDPLEKGLAEMVITDLSKIRSLDVVERVRLQALLDEIGFSSSEFVRPETGPRVGRLLGVSTLVKGSLIDLDDDALRLDAGLTATKDGTFSEAGDVTGDLDRLFRMEKDLVFSVLDRMNIVPTEEERKEILVLPTESMLAFLAYSRGLDLEDRGDMRGAREQYREAASIDPNFRMARERSQRMERFQRGMTNRAMLRRSLRIRRMTQVAVRRRLQMTGYLVKAGVLPGKDLRKAYQEREGEQPFGLVPVEVTIPIP